MSGCFEQSLVPPPARLTPDHADQIFAFEQDFAGSLRCIPMITRFKLDLCGVKLTLRQWSQFGRETRAALVGAPCDTLEEVAGYRAALMGYIRTEADEPPKLFDVEQAPEWAETTRTAEPVSAWATKIGLTSPSNVQWAALSDLQRFTLIKLTRAGHDNDNFYPAMMEFGLVALGDRGGHV
jgi:hypothetical protein